MSVYTWVNNNNANILNDQLEVNDLRTPKSSNTSGHLMLQNQSGVKPAKDEPDQAPV